MRFTKLLDTILSVMFMVEPKYAATNNPLAEFKAMVKVFTKRALQVILDVVFNHSAESEQTYPIFSQRGIDDQTYYWRNDQGRYINWSSCGNMSIYPSDVGAKWWIACVIGWSNATLMILFDLATALGVIHLINSSAQLFTDIK